MSAEINPPDSSGDNYSDAGGPLSARRVQVGKAPGWPLAGNSGRYLAVRNSDSAKALSALKRGREYEGLTPSQYNIDSTRGGLELSAHADPPCARSDLLVLRDIASARIALADQRISDARFALAKLLEAAHAASQELRALHIGACLATAHMAAGEQDACFAQLREVAPLV